MVRVFFVVVCFLFLPWVNQIRKVDFRYQSNVQWQKYLPNDLNENSGIFHSRYSIMEYLARGALVSLMSCYIIKTPRRVDFN